MTSFVDVKARLNEAFSKLTPSDIKKCVNTAREKLQSLYDHLLKIDQLSSDEESSASSDDGNGGDEEYDSSAGSMVSGTVRIAFYGLWAENEKFEVKSCARTKFMCALRGKLKNEEWPPLDDGLGL
ncbi:hypothetical protein AC1031_019951 [Aphanomyces cochlioides]|nr:hypothetical protein AC1031_019951 [Aphanomyces cochlioides]